MNVPKPKNTWLLPVLMLSLLMTACAGQPQTFASACPQLPSRPVALQPKPPQDYSRRAAEDIEMWQQRLQATLPTSSNAPPPGRGE